MGSRTTSCQLVALIVSVTLAVSIAQHVVLHDASEQYLAESVNVDAHATHLAAAAGSACKLASPKLAAADDSSANLVKSIVTADAFKAPKALVVLNVVGSKGSALIGQVSQAFSGKHTVTAAAGKEAASADAWVRLTNDLAASNPDVTVATLDHSGAQCDVSCLLGQLPVVAKQLGGKLHLSGKAARQQGLQGAALQLPGGQTLDFDQPAHRLLGLEMAAFSKALEQQLARAGKTMEQDLTVLESTFVGLQALAAAEGASQQLLEGAESAVGTLLAGAKQQLDAALDKDVLYQIAVLGDAPVAGSDPGQLMTWKETSRRVLLGGASAGRRLAAVQQDPTPDTAKSFTRKAAAYGAFFVVLYFMAAGIYCLVNMDFKQDTLLYGRSKTD